MYTSLNKKGFWKDTVVHSRRVKFNNTGRHVYNMGDHKKGKYYYYFSTFGIHNKGQFYANPVYMQCSTNVNFK